MTRQEMLDSYSVPEYYVDRLGEIEDAGNGMMRIVRCVERHGILVPVFSYISPATSHLSLAPMFQAFAFKMLREIRDITGGPAH